MKIKIAECTKCSKEIFNEEEHILLTIINVKEVKIFCNLNCLKEWINEKIQI